MYRAILAVFMMFAAQSWAVRHVSRSPAETWEGDSKVGLQLQGPRGDTYVGAATEWRLLVENRSADKLPLSGYTLGSGGYEGVRVDFEVTRAERPALRLPPDFTLQSPCGFRPENFEFKGLASRSEARLDVVFHCMQDFGEPREDASQPPRPIFRPVFFDPGSYGVTAVLTWSGTEWRSNTVTVTVVAPPASWDDALRDFKALVNEGVCLDLRGIARQNSLRSLARIERFVSATPATVYGVQASLGLAEAYAERLPQNEADKRLLSSHGLDSSFERMKALRGDRARSLEFGLEHTWDRIDRLLTQKEGAAAR